MAGLTPDTIDDLLSQPVDDNTIFTTKELAAKLKVSDRFLKKLREKGTGPLFSKFGRVRYLWADVRVFLNTYKRRSTSDTGKTRSRSKNMFHKPLLFKNQAYQTLEQSLSQ